MAVSRPDLPTEMRGLHDICYAELRKAGAYRLMREARYSNRSSFCFSLTWGTALSTSLLRLSIHSLLGIDFGQNLVALVQGTLD